MCLSEVFHPFATLNRIYKFCRVMLLCESYQTTFLFTMSYEKKIVVKYHTKITEKSFVYQIRKLCDR